jgi:hydroxymethylpyrimidine/phosphomethylpyrimidine kinase
MNVMPPVLSIAGSDNSAGAGIQADLKTMSALGVYGLTAVTCVVAEVPGKVSAIHGIPPALVAEQIRLCFEAFPVSALKTGLLFSAEILKCVVETLGEFRSEGGAPALVVDPVMVASSGHRLLEPESLQMYRTGLFPQATLVTPNVDEAAVLLGQTIESRTDLCAAGRALVREYKVAFLMKGGHLKGPVAGDVLILPEGEEHWFEAPFVHGVSTHGTGCTYSAAIASELGKGADLVTAVGVAKRFLSGAVVGYLRWTKEGKTSDALNHFAGVR